MKYAKINKDNYNLHVIETKKFKTIMIKVNFKRQLKKEEISMRNMLVNVMFESTAKYPSKRLMEIQTEELYELGYRGSNYCSGIYTVMGFDCVFLNPKYTEDGMLERSCEFFKEILFNPNVDEGGFSQNSFDIGYRILKDHIASLKENADIYSQIRLFEELEPDGLISYRSCGYAEDLNVIDRKNLYEYYLDVLKNDIVDIFVVGDVKPETIEEYFKRLFPLKKRNMISENHFYAPQFYRETVNFSTEISEFSQSKLYLGYKIKQTTYFELRYVLNVLNYILGGNPDSKLFKNVRERNSLCYTISSNTQPLVSILLIRAGIDADQYDRACALILEQIADIKNGKFGDDDIKKAIITYKNSLSELEDNSESIISLYSGIEYLASDNIKDRIKKIETVKKEDVVALAQKLSLDTIFFLEGGVANEEA